MDLSFLAEHPELRRSLVASVLAVVGVLVLRWIAVRLVRSAKWPTDAERLAWLVRIRIATLLLIVACLTTVWAEDLRTVALSAVAIAAALVIATKELILCVSGTLVRMAGESYGVGDRVEIGGHRGDVIGYGIMTTTVLEIGPAQRRTGRSIVLPNSLLLTNAVINETYSEEFVLHTFSVPLAEGADWRQAETALLEAASDVCADVLDAAREHLDATARAHGLSPPHVEPSVLLQVPEGGRISLLVRIPTRARDRARVEQAILRGYLDGATPAP